MQVIHNPSVTGMIKTSDFSDRREGAEGIMAMVNKDPLRNIVQLISPHSQPKVQVTSYSTVVNKPRNMM